MSIYQFTGTTGSEFTDIYKTEMAKNPIGIILDLRDDPGGYLDAAFEVLGHFVENGKPIAILQMDGRTETQLSEGEGEFAKTKIPMIVLVNDGTASSAEIVAGTIQDYKLGKLLGITTYGKGTVQEITTYPDNSSLKLSIAHWFTGLKRDINKIGLTPDITVTPTADDLLGKTDTQLSAAIKLLQ
jgi:carboxyl-terminal processing protease